MGRVSAKGIRHEQLHELLQRNPLHTDEELAELLQVSLSTIRLDRALLGIPELRERTRAMAERAVARLRSLKQEEFVGALMELEPNRKAMSILTATQDMAFRHTDRIWDHWIYSQASTLAIAVVEADMVIIGAARGRYRFPAHVGDQLVATAKVGVHKYNKYIVSVRTKVGDREIFVGRFIAAVVPEHAAPEEGTETC